MSQQVGRAPEVRLREAGDAMAAQIEGEHVADATTCMACNFPFPCPARQAADHWREVQHP